MYACNFIVKYESSLNCLRCAVLRQVTETARIKCTNKTTTNKFKSNPQKSAEPRIINIEMNVWKCPKLAHGSSIF